VQILLKISKIKAYAIMYGMESVEQKDGDIILRLRPEQNDQIDGQKLFEIAQDFPGKIRFSTGEKIGIIFKTKGMPHKQALEMIEQFLIKYKDVPKPKGAVQHATE
jgi:transcription-repair coupling factor (superfamily II helicase)